MFDEVTNRVAYKDYFLTFGKYKGDKLMDVYNKDPDYFFWLADKAGNDLKAAIGYILEQEAMKWQENTQKTKK